jgi:hypothetical protein
MSEVTFTQVLPTTLAAPYTAGDSSITVVDASKLPASAAFALRINDNVFRCTGVAGATFTVAGGQEGSVDANASIGDDVYVVQTALTLANLLRQQTGAQFVFRPGGTAGGNVYTDFGDLCTAVQACPVKARIFIDPSLGAATVASDAYTLNFAAGGRPSFEALVGSAPTLITFANGATLTDCYPDLVGVELLNENTSSPIFTTTTDYEVHCCGLSAMVNAGGSNTPHIKISSRLYAYFHDVSYCGNGTSEVLQADGAQAVVQVYLLDVTNYGSSAIKLTNSGQGIVYAVSSVYGANSAQPNAPGITTIFPSTASTVAYSDSSPLLDAVTVQAAIDALKTRVSTFVFRPAGSPSNGIYTTFASLATAVNSVFGPRVILYDTTGLSSPSVFTVPAASYTLGFSNGPIELRSFYSGSDLTPTLNFANGTTLDGFFSTLRNVSISHANTTNPLYTLSVPGEVNLHVYDGSQINPTAGTSPIIKVSYTGSGGYAGFLLTLHDRSVVNNYTGVTGAEVFQIDGANTVFIAYLHDNSIFGDSSIRVTNSPAVVYVNQVSAAAIASVSQPNWSGAAVVLNELASCIAYADSSPALGAGTVQAAIDAVKALANKPIATLVWQPGGTAGANVYTTAATIAAAAAAIVGNVDILVDPTHGPPNFPNGTYNFGSVGERRLIGNPQGSYNTAITTGTGNVVITGITELRDCGIQHSGTNAAGLFPITNQYIFRVTGQGYVDVETGATAFFNVNGGLLEFYMSESAGVLTLSSGTNALVVTSGVAVVRLYGSSFVFANMLSDNGGAGVIYLDVQSPAATYGAQASYATPHITIASLATNVSYSDTSPTLGATNVQAAIDAVKTKAATAETDAQTGITNAASAQSTANSASSAASTAQSTANTALAAAAAAQTTANSKLSTVALTGDVTGTGGSSIVTTLAAEYTYAQPGTTFDGQGSAIVPSAATIMIFPIPYKGTITGWTMVGDAVGSAVVDVWKVASGGVPNSGNSIAGTDMPTLSGVQVNIDTSLSGWGSTAIAKGDMIAFSLVSASTLKRLHVSLQVTKLP